MKKKKLIIKDNLSFSNTHPIGSNKENKDIFREVQNARKDKKRYAFDSPEIQKLFKDVK